MNNILSPFTTKRIQKDLHQLKKNYKTCFFKVNDLSNLSFIIIQPDFDIKEHKFKKFYILLNLTIPTNYPFEPPIINNIEHNGCMMKGNICLSNFSHFHKTNTNPSWDLLKLFMAIVSMQDDNNITGVGWVNKPNLNNIIKYQKIIQEKIDSGFYDNFYGDEFVADRLTM